MPIPIGVTPVLRGKEATAFLKRLNDDLKSPVGLTPTPKLKDAIKLIRRQHKARQTNIRYSTRKT